MGRSRLKWGQVRAYLEKRHYEIRASGGDKMIIAPADGKARLRNVIRIGHTSCSHPGDELLKCYESALRRAFGIDPDDIRDRD